MSDSLTPRGASRRRTLFVASSVAAVIIGIAATASILRLGPDSGASAPKGAEPVPILTKTMVEAIEDGRYRVLVNEDATRAASADAAQAVEAAGASFDFVDREQPSAASLGMITNLATGEKEPAEYMWIVYITNVDVPQLGGDGAEKSDDPLEDLVVLVDPDTLKAEHARTLQVVKP